MDKLRKIMGMVDIFVFAATTLATVVLAASDKKSVHNNAGSHFVVSLSFQK